MAIMSEAEGSSIQINIPSPFQRPPGDELILTNVALERLRSSAIGLIRISLPNISQEARNEQPRQEEQRQDWATHSNQNNVPVPLRHYYALAFGIGASKFA